MKAPEQNLAELLGYGLGLTLNLLLLAMVVQWSGRPRVRAGSGLAVPAALLGLVYNASSLWGFVARGDCCFPGNWITDTDGRGNGLRIFHGLSQHERSRARGLPAKHARAVVQFCVAFPIGGDVSRVTHGHEMVIRRTAELLHNFSLGRHDTPGALFKLS